MVSSACLLKKMLSSAFPSGLPMLEKLDLAETFLRFLDCLIRASEILSLTGNDLVSARNFLDHSDPPACQVRAERNEVKL